jgi:hypothetical protein
MVGFLETEEKAGLIVELVEKASWFLAEEKKLAEVPIENTLLVDQH